MSLFIRHHGLYLFQKYFYIRLWVGPALLSSALTVWSPVAALAHYLEDLWVCTHVSSSRVQAGLERLCGVCEMNASTAFIGLSQPLPFLCDLKISACVCVSCHLFLCLLPSTLELSFSLWDGVPSELLRLLAGGGTRVLRVTLVMCISCGELSVPVVCTDGNMTPCG